MKAAIVIIAVNVKIIRNDELKRVNISSKEIAI